MPAAKMTLDEAKAVEKKLRDERDANWKLISDLEQPAQDRKAEASETLSKAAQLQSDYLESIGLGKDDKGGPNSAFLAKVAEQVGSTVAMIKTMQPRSTSRWDSPIVQNIFNITRAQVPDLAEVVALKAEGSRIYKDADRMENDIRSSPEYRAAKEEGRRLDWDIRNARENIDRLQKNEEARERKQAVAESPNLKETARVRGRLNAIADGKETFTWKP